MLFSFEIVIFLRFKICGFFFLLQNYHFETSMGNNILFLSGKSQSNLNNAFIDAMPWFSFGRKNVGYLYAIANGAKVIWDFDDDNLLKFWMKGASPDESLEIDNFIDNLQGKLMVETKLSYLGILQVSYSRSKVW